MVNKLQNAEVGDMVKVFDYATDNYVQASVEEVLKDELGGVYAVFINRDYTDSEYCKGSYISARFDNPNEYELLKSHGDPSKLKVGDTVYVKDYGLPTEPHVEMKVKETAVLEDYSVIIELEDSFVDWEGNESTMLDVCTDDHIIFRCDKESTPINYEDDAISESYSEAASKGKTFADYTGTSITAESLGFESDVDKTIKTITPESLAFKESLEDSVNHPSHYNYGDIEVIDFIEQVTDQYEEGFDAYIVGNALKYLSRAPHKNGLEDVKKAVWYLERLIKRNEDE